MCRREQDKFGKILYSAIVMFKNPEDATKAYKEYHDADLDGKVIKIQFLADGKSSSAGSGRKITVKIV